MSLQSRFLSQIDLLSDKLLKVFQKRGGEMGRRLQTIMEPMAQDDDVDVGRECIIKRLCVYLNEDPDNLVKEYVDGDEAFVQKSTEETTVGIYFLKFCDRSDDIGIILEGQNILQGLDNFALATATLFGLMYALNLNYPPEMKSTFEVLQKIVMELEGSTLSKKAQVLRNRLYECPVNTMISQ